MKIEIRKETPKDYHETEAMTRRSFYNVYGPGCDEHLLVHKLRTHKDFLPDCSRIALVDGEIAGVIMYFKCMIHGEDGDVEVASFGPLCVDHKYKNCGIGRKLLEETIPLVEAAGFPGIVIMGEPWYYPKVGFRRCREFGITDMEGNAYDPFMGLELVEGGLHIKGGQFEESSVVEECTEEALAELEKDFPPLKKISQPCQWSYENAYDDREGYHYAYATHFPRQFEGLFKEMQKDADDGIMKEIWENFDKTPYVLMTGQEVFGIFVINHEDSPVIEHMYLLKEPAEAERIEKEIRERLAKANSSCERE